MKKTAISLLLALAIVFSLVLAAAPAVDAAALHPHDSGAQNHCSCGDAANSAAIEGHTHETGTITWEAWPGRENLVDGGHYYLTADLTGDGSDSPLYCTNEDKKSFTLCFNGYNVTQSQRTWARADKTVTFCDCSSTPGTLTSTFGTENDQGCTINIQANAVMNIFDINVRNTATSKRGGNIQVSGTLNMYSGSVAGGKAVLTNSNDVGGGGNVYVDATGTFNMYGGELSDGTARLGGNLCSRGNVNIYANAVIKNGKASYQKNADIIEGIGGNIYIYSGTLKIAGGTISGGTAVAMANDVFVLAATSVKIVNANASFTLDVSGTDVVAVDVSGLDSSLTSSLSGTTYTFTKSAAGGTTGGTTTNPGTGDSANLAVMGLGLVLGVAGMACLLPKKQKV